MRNTTVTKRNPESRVPRHCEECNDEAIRKKTAIHWIASFLAMTGDTHCHFRLFDCKSYPLDVVHDSLDFALLQSYFALQRALLKIYQLTLAKFINESFSEWKKCVVLRSETNADTRNCRIANPAERDSAGRDVIRQKG